MVQPRPGCRKGLIPSQLRRLHHFTPFQSPSSILRSCKVLFVCGKCTGVRKNHVIWKQWGLNGGVICKSAVFFFKCPLRNDASGMTCRSGVDMIIWTLLSSSINKTTRFPKSCMGRCEHQHIPPLKWYLALQMIFPNHHSYVPVFSVWRLKSCPALKGDNTMAFYVCFETKYKPKHFKIFNTVFFF